MRFGLFPFLLVAASATCANGAFAPAVDLRFTAVSAEASSVWHSVPPGGVTVDSTAQPPQNRGKVNEIDFCMAPSDVSLSRSYGNAVEPSYSSVDLDTTDPGEVGGSSTSAAPRVLSLTRALNNASNRALRRILLSRSWPSAEALNLSLRQVLASGGPSSTETNVSEPSQGDTDDAAAETSGAKCPVPRPILNIIMRRRSEGGFSIDGSQKGVVTQPGENTPMPRSKRGRTDEEWVADQLEAFRESYGAIPGYPLADAYLECILSLATSGAESTRTSEVLADGVYDESYRRFVSVLKSVGAVFEPIPGSDPPRTKISLKLVDKDICLSLMDKLMIKTEKTSTAGKDTTDEEEGSKDSLVEESFEVASDKSTRISQNENVAEEKGAEKTKKAEKGKDKSGMLRKLLFWIKDDNEEVETMASEQKAVNNVIDTTAEVQDKVNDLKPEDLGAVLLSAEEPSMTRQLNVLSNIVQRALLFGGDQELLVLSETLEADKPAFIRRWYPETSNELAASSREDEQRPGVQYFNCLVQLLKDCYSKGALTDLDAPFPLAQSYANAYERLTAGLVELGSGYVKPLRMKAIIPKTAQEELGRFAQWESSFRKSSPDITAYPDDLVGSYEVKDEIGGETIGMSTVTFKPEGDVVVAPPLQGLRWRLDPGPTHLDTCTFQVLGDDGAILQYRGFVDRGARLESRFSKRPIKIRGAVTFQMRDGDSALMGEDYRKDVLPVNYQTGTTRFVMTKAAEENS